jgi:predicted acyltransferase
MRMLLPVGRSGLAIAAGYAGLFALLIVPAPLALLLGVLAVRDIRKNPKKHGMGRAIFGIVVGAFGTALLAFFALSLAIGR